MKLEAGFHISGGPIGAIKSYLLRILSSPDLRLL